MLMRLPFADDCIHADVRSLRSRNSTSMHPCLLETSRRQLRLLNLPRRTRFSSFGIVEIGNCRLNMFAVWFRALQPLLDFHRTNRHERLRQPSVTSDLQTDPVRLAHACAWIKPPLTSQRGGVDLRTRYNTVGFRQDGCQILC